AWQALGDALEDSAWLAAEVKYYPEAVKAFQRAVKEADEVIPLRIAQRRCQFKWVAYGDGDKNAILGPAANVLEAAITRKPQPGDEAQAQYWLANVYRLQGDYGKAETAFKRVTEGLLKSLTGAAREWDRLATRDLAFLALDDAE